MTDAAKTDGQVDDYQQACAAGIFKCMSDELCPTHKPAKCKECRDYYTEIEAHIIVNASARIRAETVEQVISKLTIENLNGYTDASVIRQISALAAAPPGFVCVPVEPTQAQYDAVWQGLQQDHFKRVRQVLSFDELRKLYQEFHKGMLAESGK